MSQRLKQYVDEYENIHIQDKVLGRGGQGIVFRTKDPDLAIKLVTDENGNPVIDKDSLEKYSTRFKRVRLLPLPERLNLSVPVSLLKDNAGYVMKLLSEMVPFKHFWYDEKSRNIMPKDIPDWLSGMPERQAQKIIHYCKTGGLRRRLIAFYKCASLLARLHGNGLVYGDISHDNIFISEGLEDSSVWLIDADNIRFEIANGGSAVYTPRYGAPEVVQGKDSARPTSDCHSFAVVAFYILSLIHPFVGKKVDGTGEDDWADEDNDDEDVEDKAYAGFLPWVDDKNDDSNSSNSGLPRTLLLTIKLKNLFETTFEEGRTSPWLRPTIYHWPQAFAQAADTTVICPHCSMSYYYDFVHPETDNHNCPYCKTLRPQIIILETYRWNGPHKLLSSPSWRYIREVTENHELTIPRRVFTDFTMVDSDTPEVTLTLTKKNLLLKKSDQSKTTLSVAVVNNQKNSFQKVYSQLKIDRTSSKHSFWIFVHSDNPRLVLCSISGGGK